MTTRLSILKGGLFAIVLAVSMTALVHAQQIQSLRGDASLGSTNAAQMPPKQDRSQSAMSRAYRQQPPLIPHKIDEYQVDLKVNQCMNCHDWPRNVDVGAPKISETHYIDRNGVALDRVSETRWFCTQCHVTQANAKPLVGNLFKNATQVGN